MGYKGLQGESIDPESLSPSPDHMTETSVDISAVKMSLQTFAVYLKVETPGPEAKEKRKRGVREAYQLMGHKVWTQEIVRTRCLQTGKVTMDLKREKRFVLGLTRTQCSGDINFCSPSYHPTSQGQSTTARPVAGKKPPSSIWRYRSGF
jgi:hypothetical protein